MGTLGLIMGAIAWDLSPPSGLLHAYSSIVDISPAALGSPHRWLWRLLGPLNGTLFVLAGLYMLWGALHCYGIPDLSGPLALSDWPGITPWVLLVGAIGIYNARLLRGWPMRAFYVAGTFAFGFAGGQATGFHTRAHSTQWFVIATGALPFSGIAWFADKFLASRAD